MGEPTPLFKTLSIEPDPASPLASQGGASQPTAQEHARAIALIQVALSTIWQQFVIATSHLFTLASVASAFVLWLLIQDPNTKQLIALGMYAAFILAANLLVLWSRRK